MKLYNKQELKQQQSDGSLAITSFEPSERYADKWKRCSSMMSSLTPELFYSMNSFILDDQPSEEKWADENIPDKSYATRYSGPMFGCDWDYMVGPEDWNDAHDKPKVGDYVLRKKIYFYAWSEEKYQMYLDQGNPRNPDIEYFLEMHLDYKDILDHYYQECFTDQADDIERLLYKMMIIEYSCPTANADNIRAHLAFNTSRFGDSHCDETLCGLHMGENIQEVEAQSTLTKEWIPAKLVDSQFLFMFSEHAERSGWTPTYHRMIPNKETNLTTRYVIVFDLQARYKEEN